MCYTRTISTHLVFYTLKQTQRHCSNYNYDNYVARLLIKT